MPTAWERDRIRASAEEELQERESEAAEENARLAEHVKPIENLLVDGVSNPPELDYADRFESVPSVASVKSIAIPPEPSRDRFLPNEPGALGQLIPGWARRHQRKMDNANHTFESAKAAWRDLVEAEAADYRNRVDDIEQRAAAARMYNESIESRREDGRRGAQTGVEDYVRWAIDASDYPFEVDPVVRYLPSRKELLVELDYPLIGDVVPDVSHWVHVKTRKVVEPRPRSDGSRKLLYRSVIAQTTLRVLYECFTVDAYRHIQKISFKGSVRGISPTTGRPVRPVVVSLQTDREVFLDRNFLAVDAIKLLKSLRANVSDEPTELKPVPLVVEFDISDPRLIEEEDILSRLDDRDNLIDLSAAQFEAVITNLFNRMGYQAYPTLRSKDGGVDCIAYYSDPVGVNKCVIQAKKWTIPVGVDAIRDLAGVIDHERASKGILVTTSRVAPAGKKFIEGKPMQIIEGEQLLDLFRRYTDRRVTIVFPMK